MQTHIHIFTILTLVITAACAAPQVHEQKIELQPLEEYKAIEIITSTLASRGYKKAPETTIQLSNNTQFICDFTVAGESIALEYVTDKDTQVKGVIPDAAAGSRLQVIPATAIATDANAAASPSIYLMVIKDKDYMYHARPTPEMRAPVTFHEVENRLRRDITDFLSWYENKPQ
jgi:hypothetical protein